MSDLTIPSSEVDVLIANELGLPVILQGPNGGSFSLREALRMVGCEMADSDVRYAAERGIRAYVSRDAGFVRRRIKEALPDYS